MEQQLWHPEWRGGFKYWTDGSVEAVMDKVRFGDPVKGWEGDERLALYACPTPEGMIWELCRLEHDDQYRLVARSRPDVPFNDTIIDHLIAHDRQRGYDVQRAVTDANARLDRQRAVETTDEIREEIAPRLRHALVKDGIA